MSHYQIPRNLPHASTIARRIHSRLLGGANDPDSPETAALMEHLEQIQELLEPYDGGEEPADAEGERVASEAAAIGRELVAAIESAGIGEDRLGQLVRNLFECLGMGEEGAELSLRAGEDPNSLMRP